MATYVYDTLEIKLENGDEIVLRPLSIKNLRKFMHIVNNQVTLEDVEDELEAMDGFLKAAVFLVSIFIFFWIKRLETEYLEDLLTVPTVLKILEIAGGLKTADPNLMGAGLAGMN